jgi:hypothetical protein
MRSFVLLSAAAALTLASPVPQELDFSLIDTVETPSNVTVPTNTEELVVIYDSDSAAAAVQTSVLTGQTEIDISNSTTNSTGSSTLRRRGTCAAQASGSGPVPSPDTASAFLSYSAFASAASAAATPSGYPPPVPTLHASNHAYGYLGFTNLASYDSEKCASKCNAISGCAAFNLYYERDPSKDPGTGCENPSSTTNIKVNILITFLIREDMILTVRSVYSGVALSTLPTPTMPGSGEASSRSLFRDPMDT